MKKILAIFLSLCMLFAVNAVHANAVEDSYQSSFTAISIGGETASPQAVTNLWSTTGTWFIDDFNVQVTPTKGTNLKLILNATDICVIRVYKGSSLIPSKTITYAAGSGTQRIDLVNNCNGGSYRIKFTNNTGVTIYGTITQAEYI